MPDPLETLAADVETALANGEAERALRGIIGFVRTVNADPAAAGHIFASTELDGLLARTAAALPPVDHRLAASDTDHTAQIYLATELYLAGGHTRVLEDFITAQPGRTHRVLLTNLHRRPPTEEMVTRFEALGASVTWADEPALVATAQWVATQLASQPHARVFLFVHHEDAPAWAGCLLARPARLYLCHHADHHLALGLHTPGLHSIELTSFSYHHSRDALGLHHVTYIPLTSKDIPARASSDFQASPADPTFITSSSGNAGKFRHDYSFSYPDIIAQRLARFGGTHLHIGGLDQATSAAFATAAASLQVDPNRLHHVPQVPDLGPAMALNHVSVYLSSFPVVGARASIEVMASGTPIIGHHHLWSEFLGGACLLPPASPAWRRPADLWEILAGMTPARQAQCGATGRAHWERNHHPRILAQCLIDDVTGIPPPPRNPAALPDPLHDFLALRTAAADFAGQHQVADRLLVLESRLVRAHASLAKARRELQRLRRPETTPLPSWTERLLRPLAKLERSLRKRLP